jgi:hypothetical protein
VSRHGLFNTGRHPEKGDSKSWGDSHMSCDPRWGNCRRGCPPSYLDRYGYCSPACHVGAPRGEFVTLDASTIISAAGGLFGS